MTHALLKFIIRRLPDGLRMRVLIICLMESALVRPGQAIDVHLHVEKDGTWTFREKAEE